MSLQYKEFGLVKAVRGCIVTIKGLEHCINGQLIRFGYGTLGMIIGFSEDETQVLIVKEQEPIKTGDTATMTLEPFNVPVSSKYLGRMVNVLGEPLDGLGVIPPEVYLPIFPEAPSILEREIIKETLETGIKIIDTIIPIGKGQRELILGDKMTGKTTLCTDIIINQKGKNVICIYCSIGKSKAAMSRVVELFKKFDMFDYGIIVAAMAGQPPGQMYLAPYVASSIGELFMNQGRDVLVIFDDFTKHAWAYREISLILGRPPGRESYPGDVFYLHSRMIERAAKLNKEKGGGSMTFLPIVELLEGDLTGYVPSNLVSMTDGQLYLSAQLFNDAFKPAVGIGLSVSRIGSKVQWPAIKKVSKTLRLEYVRFEELQRLSRLKASGQSEETERELGKGKILYELLKQDRDKPVPMEGEVLMFLAHNKGLLEDLEMGEIAIFKEEIYDFAFKRNPEVLQKLRAKRDFDEGIEQELIFLINDYLKVLMEKRAAEGQEQEAAVQEITISANK
ncbi:MAG: F0F1 ATP synthase subunit alpha [Candidatus Omnitrophica bacterium]|jgi:F-type H+-transporting ATPase subunit alpha|nr:F0F1 ATP synthase subunit alpha [Candidatus Omnitrophota bacterium]